MSKHTLQFSTTVFKKSFTVPPPPRVLSKHLPQQKMVVFYAYVHRAFILLISRINLNVFFFLNSLGL